MLPGSAAIRAARGQAPESESSPGRPAFPSAGRSGRKWWAQQDSNLRPKDYESSALTG